MREEHIYSPILFRSSDTEPDKLQQEWNNNCSKSSYIPFLSAIRGGEREENLSINTVQFT